MYDQTQHNRIKRVMNRTEEYSTSSYGAKTRELEKEKSLILHMLSSDDEFYSSDQQLYIVLEIIRDRVPNFTISKTRYIDFIKSRDDLHIAYLQWVKQSRKESVKVRHNVVLTRDKDGEMKVKKIRDRKFEIEKLLASGKDFYKRLVED